MKVLVLDDHQAFRDEVVEMLARKGHEALAVGKADEAIPLAEGGEYDFVLVDFSMPEHDGVWFMKHVKLPAHTKALLVTAHVNKEIMARMFNLGAAGYLIKPFDEGDLMRNLQFHWRGSAARSGASRGETPGTAGGRSEETPASGPG